MQRLRTLTPFIAAALLGALAMDFPQTLWPFIFVFLIPLIAYAVGDRGAKTARGLILRMFVFGFLFAILSTPWVASTYPLTWLNIPEPVLGALIVLLIWASFALMLALPVVPWMYVLHRIRRQSPYVLMLVGASSWILLEYARSWLVAIGAYGDAVLFGPHHAYYSLAYVLSGVPVVRDLFPMGGLYLATFLIVLTNFVLYYIYRIIRFGAPDRTHVFVPLIAILSVVIVSSLTMSYIRAEDTDGARQTISVMNTHLLSNINDEVTLKKTRIALDVISQIDASNGILFVPENVDVLNSYLEARDPASNPLSRFRLVVASHPDTDAHSMYFFEPDTKRGVRYQKQLLMPIGEYSVDWVEYLVHTTGNRSWIDVYDYRVVQHGTEKGTGIALYGDRLIPSLKFAGTICAENISPYIFRDQTRAGATVLSNISSLSPFRNSGTLGRQTLAIDMTRALENGRYLVMAGNDNESFVIADTGDIVAISGDEMPNSFFNTEIQVHTYTTPYVHYGDYMLLIAGALLLIICVWLAI